MASNLKYSVTLKNDQQAAITTRLGASAAYDLYDGTQPTSPETAVTTQNLLATLVCSTTLAPAPSGGVLILNAISNGTGTAAAGTGKTANWYRLRTSAGVAHVDGTVGISGCDLNLNNPNIATGQTVSVSSSTYTNGN
ncbi:Phage protein [Caballeronia glathei]|uniref:Uncharacterized protein n=1 Tax=Caballeronia glathei TaxID=60547 RepID=A0A069PLF8_9BURK|nr:hypothetical protein [Caballeronia glathei]KDR41533.1 hypothetical protein BG61_16640 [Caballeronia glathei]CDY79496.1 Phage protein [Caballeronia glathei]